MTDAPVPANLELAVERHIAARPARVWAIMTERMPEWFCPRPWVAEIIEQDWRPGGRSAMMMRGPNGEESLNDGVFLDVVPGARFVFTDAFTTGWHPKGPFIVGIFEIAPDGTDGGGTHYRASARHWTAEACEQHKAMAFDAGWGAAADQLKALAEADE